MEKTKTMDRSAALRELRALVATYLEGSDDAARATALLDTLDLSRPHSTATTGTSAETASERRKREDREYAMFGTTTESLDAALANKSARDVAMYAMGALSNAQERIHPEYGSEKWRIAEGDANTIRQLMNIAKYAIDKTVPR